MLCRAPAGCARGARIRPLAMFGRIARGRTELGVKRSLLMVACERRGEMFLVVVITHVGVTIGDEPGLHIELDALIRFKTSHRIRINLRSVMEIATCNPNSLSEVIRSKSNPVMETGLISGLHRDTDGGRFFRIYNVDFDERVNSSACGAHFTVDDRLYSGQSFLY